MRIQHVAQTVKGWPDATARDRQEGAQLADIIEQHIRWRLWHGQVERALDLMAKAAAPDAASASKLAGVLRGLETYVAGHAELIIDYAVARRREEPISAAATESTVQWLLYRRMNASQQMRWSPAPSAPDAQSSDFGCERHARPGSCLCRMAGQASVSSGCLITPRFSTVSV